MFRYLNRHTTLNLISRYHLSNYLNEESNQVENGSLALHVDCWLRFIFILVHF